LAISGDAGGWFTPEAEAQARGDGTRTDNHRDGDDDDDDVDVVERDDGRHVTVDKKKRHDGGTDTPKQASNPAAAATTTTTTTTPESYNLLLRWLVAPPSVEVSNTPILWTPKPETPKP